MRLLILSLLIMTQLSCITAKKQNAMLDGYRQDLTSALKNDVNTEQKIDILGTSLVEMMTQSLEFKSSIKAGKFVKKFGDQNADIITEIIEEVQSSVSSNPLLIMSLMNKPYVKDLINLIPKFEQKFKRIAWVAKIMGKVSKPLGMLNGGNTGGINLGNLLGSEEE